MEQVCGFVPVSSADKCLRKRDWGREMHLYTARLIHNHPLIKNILVYPPLLTGYDTTRLTQYLLWEEINILFDIRHVLMRANCVCAYGVGPLCA